MDKKIDKVEINFLYKQDGYWRAVSQKASYPTNVYGVKVNTSIIGYSITSRPGIIRNIKYIVLHETDNFDVGSDAKSHANYLNKNTSRYVSWHYTVDDKEIYHHVPDNEIAYHASVDEGNDYGIGIELCVNKDSDFEKTFDNATKLVAYLLNEYDLDVSDIKTHNYFSGKNCPHKILSENRLEEFIKKVEDIKENYVK